ncbi:hypothetical protein [Anaerorhabdus sp.]|uniref:hypothetical protein n=1 Tax=Anaerorhabdus sp. TaxID=1872524 RepID=UPI002FC86435
MANYKRIEENGLLYILQKIKAVVDKYVIKEDGKGLSANDLSNALKSNYDSAYTHSQGAHAPVGAEVNKIDVVKVNGTALPVSSKSVDIAVPKTTNDLTNNSGFINSATAQTLINDAVSGITGIDIQVVASLPVTGIKGVIYLKSKAGASDDVYDEYIWVNTKYEHIGNTSVDLSSCVKTNEMIAIPNSEIDTVFSSVFG